MVGPGSGPTIILGPIRGRFFQDTLAFFQDTAPFSGYTEKNRRRVGPDHYLGPIPAAFFRIRLRFFQDTATR